MLLLQLFIFLFLGLICYQDMRYRAVYWILFPLLSFLLFFLKKDYAGFSTALTESYYGLLFIVVQVFLLWIYFSVKNKKLINITRHYLGLGDILFLLTIAFYLSPVNYILFYVGSLIIILVYTLTQQLLMKKVNPEIPLAGLQALILGIVMIFSIINPSLKLYTDSWIYGL